jgi:hypothetical protein
MFNGTVAYPPCYPSDSCHIGFGADYHQNPDKYFLKYSPICPLECDSIRYDTRMSSQNYPSKEEYDLFKKNAQMVNEYTNVKQLNVTTYSEYKKYFFKLNVFYNSMEYTYVTLTPKITLVGLLSSLGGSLGALLGFTLFTFFEVLEMLLNVIYILIFHK